MTKIHHTQELNYTAEEMFKLVDDIDAYKEFVPYCKDSYILDRNEKDVTGTLSLGHGLIKKSFTTRNVLIHHSKIEMNLVKGPFKKFKGEWLFRPTEKGSHIEMTMEFSFSNPLLSKALSHLFSEVADQLITAFVARAKEIYGER